jgi:siroheme synthase-like protein
MSGKYLPINLSFKDRKVLMVGGGNVALRKLETLMDYQADVTVIAPEAVDKIDYFGSSGKIKVEKRSYNSPEASTYGMVISASDNEEVNRQVYVDCTKAGVLVNVVDNPGLCTFTFPATMRRDCLSLAISTDGKAPFLSAHLRQILEDLFPKHWEKIARLAAEYRRMAQERWPDDLEARTTALDNFLAADWKTIVKEKKGNVLHNVLISLLEPQEEAPETTSE